jgi:hypothetical protein
VTGFQDVVDRVDTLYDRLDLLVDRHRRRQRLDAEKFNPTLVKNPLFKDYHDQKDHNLLVSAESFGNRKKLMFGEKNGW